MTVFAAIVLFIGAVFNVVTWPRFFARVAKDPRSTDAAGAKTAFYRVHLVLVGVAIVIAIASVVAGILILLP